MKDAIRGLPQFERLHVYIPIVRCRSEVEFWRCAFQSIIHKSIELMLINTCSAKFTSFSARICLVYLETSDLARNETYVRCLVC